MMCTRYVLIDKAVEIILEKIFLLSGCFVCFVLFLNALKSSSPQHDFR